MLYRTILNYTVIDKESKITVLWCFVTANSGGQCYKSRGCSRIS